MKDLLFCVPHSGASTSVFRSWPIDGADPLIVPLERPGRGVRSRETPASDLTALIADQARCMREEITRHAPERWSILGHSFGSVLAFLAADRVQRDTGRPAHRVLVSAGLPPSEHRRGNDIAGWSDDDLDRHLVEIGATAPELLASPIGAILRRHFREDHGYRAEFHQRVGTRSPAPLVAITATDDRYAPPSAMARWADIADGDFALIEIEGGHFALLDRPEWVLSLLDAPVPQMVGERA